MTRNQSFPVEISWKTLLQDCGMRPDDVLRRAGLPADLFTRPDLMLPTEDYFRFWRSIEDETGDPAFALRLVEMLSAEV